MENIPTVVDFDLALADLFRKAQQEGETELLVNSGDLHRSVGGYPAYQNRITTCCGAMRRVMTTGDRIVHQPPEGNGASLDIVYTLPRLTLIRHFVAYHSFSKRGPYNTDQATFSHYSNRPLSFLEKSKGQRIWVIGGEKDKSQTKYMLLSYFSPELIEKNPDKGFTIEGGGLGFNPPIELNSQSWFAELIKKQGNFSLGINEIKNLNIIEGLLELDTKDEDDESLPEEVSPLQQLILEGAVKQITVNAYERNRGNRTDCINHYGAICQVCEMDFGKVYGEIGKDFIEVHHIMPLHKSKESHGVNPIEDLIPVCPNCHAMLHRRKEDPYTVEELKAKFKGYKALL